MSKFDKFFLILLAVLVTSIPVIALVVKVAPLMFTH